MRMQRYDAERTLDAFASRASRPVDFDALRVELLRVLSDTIQAAQTSVWVRGAR
ncbi:MAG TPA: hypothetical protein VGS17_11430 [Candidatus Limnocylindria bacterium]|nr:hypothetical protein [Candidatus Limnocylindria bacterium]